MKVPKDIYYVDVSIEVEEMRNVWMVERMDRYVVLIKFISITGGTTEAITCSPMIYSIQMYFMKEVE